MASFCLLESLIVALLLSITSPSLSSPQLKLDTPSTISAAPAVLPTEPPSESPYFPELSPDVAPLLPSPGGVLPSPTASSIPTIPSNPSPPYPDEVSVGPDSAFAPLGAESSALSLINLMWAQKLLKFCSFLVYFSVLALVD